jgi:hypothetical protein
MRWICHAVTVGLLVAVLLGAYCLWHAAGLAIQSENTYHAELLTMNLVCEFVEQEKRWPSSWDDLRDVDPGGGFGVWNWPGVIADVQALVEIDFAFDINTMDEVSYETFSGITPKRTIFDHDDAWLNRLGIAAHECAAPRAAP